MSAVTVERAIPEHADALAAFFAAAGSTCFCRYWHFEGDKNAWLERAAFSPETNEREMREALTLGNDAGRGLCAVLGDAREIIGWLKLAPMQSLPKLRNLTVYRRLAIPTSGALAIGCILVHPAHRERGVGRALIRAAKEEARRSGASRLYAFPRRAEARLHDEEAWMGPYAAYRDEGFELCLGEDPYPILSVELPPPAV